MAHKDAVRLVGLDAEHLFIRQALASDAEDLPKSDWDAYFSPGVLGRRLSNVTRWNGQFKGNTVAGHSMLVYNMVDKLSDEPLPRLIALLHDASEAFISDLPSPFKAVLPDYQVLEAKIMALVFKYYNIPSASSGYDAHLEAHNLVDTCDQRCSDIECFTINREYMLLQGYAPNPLAPRTVALRYAGLLEKTVREYNNEPDEDDN